jgi:hypothetical protein
MAHFHGSVSGKHVHGDGSYLSGPSIGTITATSTSITFTHANGATHYRIYLLAGSPGAWVSIPVSPVTVSGLAVNTEYTLQVSGDGSIASDTRNTGTTNPGTGGGPIDTSPPETWPVIIPTVETGGGVSAGRGWANERLAFEESRRRFLGEQLSKSKVPQVKKIAKQLKDYSGEVEQVETLREMLLTLEVQRIAEESTEQKTRDIQLALAELDEIVNDDEEVADALQLMLDFESQVIRLFGVR